MAFKTNATQILYNDGGLSLSADFAPSELLIPSLGHIRGCLDSSQHYTVCLIASNSMLPANIPHRSEC